MVMPWERLPALRVDKASFHQTTKWIEDVRQERAEDVVIALVGNKTDISDKREVSFEEGQRKATELNVMFVETSAKAGFNIKTLFRNLASALPGLENQQGQGDSQMVDIQLNPTNQEADLAQTSGGCRC
eukprot:GHVT01041737.1.p1 GENE.GHVT01041737.1~~GHVT01041737.1.p1  ORF type:complete len:129 (-),score=27.37 GHVT01041737.1:1508-1894(-)